MPNNGPIVIIEISPSGDLYVDQEVTIDVSKSHDNKGTIKNIDIDPGDGTTPYKLTKPAAIIHKYKAAGEYEIFVEATDNKDKKGNNKMKVGILYIAPNLVVLPEAISVDSPTGDPIPVTYPDDSEYNIIGGVEPYTITYSQPETDLFPIGETIVNVFITDANNLQGQGTLTVTIVNTFDPPDPPDPPDPLPIIIVAPANQTVTSPDGNPVSRSWSDALVSGGTPPYVIVYRIGVSVITSPHLFPVGVNTVSITATDSLLAEGTSSFTVTILADVPTSVWTPSPSDYLGRFLVPDDSTGVRFAWSAGAIACRRVGGNLQFMIAGSELNDDPIYEISYPGYGTGAVGTLPRATLIKAWGDIYGGRRLAINNPVTRGLLWSNGILYWAYGGYYNVAGQHDPSIGVTFFNDSLQTAVSYGPWRTEEHSQKTRGYLVEVPQPFADANTNDNRIAVGSPPTSGNANSPMGSWLSVLDNFDPLTLPPNDTINPAISLACQNLLAHNLTNPQGRPAGSLYKACYGLPTSTDPTFKNAVAGGYLAYDMICAASWVKTANKEGLVMFGQIADIVPGMTYPNDTMPHTWYGPYGVPCSHGQNSTIDVGTGPKCASMVGYVWVYSAETLADVAQGSIPPYSAIESSATKLNDLASNVARPVPNPYTFGGSCFDEVDDLLFVTEVQADVITNSYEPRPIIHVFQVP